MIGCCAFRRPDGMIARVNSAQKLDELVGCVEELFASLPDTLDPRIMALRDRVDDGIFEAWQSISERRIRAADRGAGAVLLGVGALVALMVLAAWSAKRPQRPG